MIRQLTFHQWVAGWNPARLTTNIKGLAEITLSLLFFGLQINYKKHLLQSNSTLFDPFLAIRSGTYTVQKPSGANCDFLT